MIFTDSESGFSWDVREGETPGVALNRVLHTAEIAVDPSTAILLGSRYGADLTDTPYIGIDPLTLSQHATNFDPNFVQQVIEWLKGIQSQPGFHAPEPSGSFESENLFSSAWTWVVLGVIGWQLLKRW